MIYPTECRVQEKSKGRKEGLLKTFFEQCKEIADDSMGKARDRFKKIRHINGTFHAGMGKIKDRNNKDLTEGEEIKKKLQEYTEKLYIKGLNDPDNHNDVIP